MIHTAPDNTIKRRIYYPVNYIYGGMPTEFQAGLYNSWAVSNESKTQKSVSNLHVTALSNDGVIMAKAHISYDIRDVQFHPESYLSANGHIIIHNWINHI